MDVKDSTQLSLSDMVLVLRLKILCDYFLYVSIFVYFKDLHCIALHSYISYQVVFVCFSKILKKINKKWKMEKGMWNDVFCITYHGCVVKVGHIIFT